MAHVGGISDEFGRVNKLTSHSSHHNIIKVAVDLRDYFYNVMTKFMINNRSDVLKTVINLFFTITNCQIVNTPLLAHRINYKLLCLSAY